MEKIFVKPASKEILVINPDTGLPLPEEGEYVTPSPYWTRRVNDGDAVIVIKKASK